MVESPPQSQRTMFGLPILPGQIPYEQEWLHNKAALRSVDFIPGHIQDIVNSGLSFSCKTILVNRALTMFSNRVVLSNLTPIKQQTGLWGMNVTMVGYNDKHAETDFELMMLEDRAGYRRSDLSNPNLARIENIQLQMFRFVLTTTKGNNREGLEQHHMTMKSEQTVTQNGMPQGQFYPQPQEKKKLFGIF